MGGGGGFVRLMLSKKQNKTVPSNDPFELVPI